MAVMQRVFNWQFIKRIIPYFYVVMTVVILIFNDAFGEVDEFIVFSLLFFTSMGIWVLRWIFIQVKAILKLKKEKKEAELMHLKSQVNPHFFFNTLNNLYGLVEQDTEKAQQLILKLSDMMRYSIYEGQNELVKLGDEITYLENYIELHKMRYHKTIDIRFDVIVVDRSIKIMPLLFIILLENAFKHGVEKLRKDAFVCIRLTATNKEIDFEIENNFDVEEVSDSEGIGLSNLRKRLELVYPKKYKLEISKIGSDRFKANLKLTL
ncbi:histidine kinase [Flammeovirgaceae bacterium KN852]|uniref:Histidine kinase n=2 Tax=Marinigracilibium pacificum TaxID=2729599 RepID=A0A848IZH5_9BACT|nr:histidine kinase [Marinigracilibium pacificum]